MTRMLLEADDVSADVREAIEDTTLRHRIDRSSRISLVLRDSQRTLVRSQLLAARSRLTVDDRVYELASIARKPDRSLEATFELALIADLRRQTGTLTAAAGTTTRGEFIRRLAAEVGYAELDVWPGERTRIQLARDADEDSWQAIRRLAGDVGWRAFVTGQKLVVGPDDWLADRTDPIEVAATTPAVRTVEWSLDVRDPDEAETTVELDVDRWQLDAGQPVRLSGEGPADGIWLVRELSGSLWSSARTVALTRRQEDLPEPDAPPAPDDHGADGLEGILAPDDPNAGRQVTSGPVSSDGFVWPVRGQITSGFGPRRSPGGIGSRDHQGVDIGAATGTLVKAAADGTVEVAGFVSGYGWVVYIRHTGSSRGIGHRQTRYAHMFRRPEVTRGQPVRQGQIIGGVGQTGTATGPHLHFEVRTGSGPIDPLRVLPAR